MNKEHLEKLLRAVAEGGLSPEAALDQLGSFDSEHMGYAVLDLHRELRRGYPEVIFGGGKTPRQITEIMLRLAESSQGNILATRCQSEVYDYLKQALPQAKYHPMAKLIALERSKGAEAGHILIICAGTSDMPVAEEAALTAAYLGNRITRLYDVGVAGLHRLLDAKEQLMAARVIIVVAGMEGALPSVVAGLVDKPVIAVPTSVGYGASFGGVAALLGMLNSCSSGVLVVNIDNGFGAGYAASSINQMPGLED